MPVRKPFYGWWIVLVCSILGLYGAGTWHYGFGAFVTPVVQETGWSMAIVSGAFSFYRLEAGFAAPVVGFLLDKVGPKILVMGGAFCMAAGMVLLSRATSVVSFYAAAIVTASGYSFTAESAVGAPLIGKWFIKKRGLVTGFYLSWKSLGGLVVPALTVLIAAYGWRNALLAMAPLTIVVAIPLSFLLKNSPEECGLLPDGEPAGQPFSSISGVSVPAARKGEVDFTLRETVHTPAFWLLVVCFFCFQMTMSALFVHMIPYLETVGFSASMAAFVVSIVTTVSIAGRIIFGWLSAVFSKKWLLVIAFILQGVGIFALTQAKTMLLVLPFILLYAPAYGGAPTVRATILGEYYGRKNFGTIYGLMQGISIAAGVGGPVIAGITYDVTGSYYIAFVIFAVVTVATGRSLFCLRRPVPANAPAEATMEN